MVDSRQGKRSVGDRGKRKFDFWLGRRACRILEVGNKRASSIQMSWEHIRLNVRPKKKKKGGLSVELDRKKNDPPFRRQEGNEKGQTCLLVGKKKGPQRKKGALLGKRNTRERGKKEQIFWDL